MKRQKMNSKATSKRERKSEEKSTQTSVQPSQLDKLFEDKLKALYWTEKAPTIATK